MRIVMMARELATVRAVCSDSSQVNDAIVPPPGNRFGRCVALFSRVCDVTKAALWDWDR